MGLPDRFTNYFNLINQYIDRALPSSDSEPRPIYEAMRYSLFAGGKRLRPILTLAVTESLDGPVGEILPVAAAIEMIHTYSLIHDDLPSMDNDDFRRGKPTNHKVFGEAIAVLAGDALLTTGFHEIAKTSYSSEIRAELAIELAESIGPGGMIGGQALDIIGRSIDAHDLEKMHRMKTAALLRYSAVAPAIILGSSENIRAALGQYGESIGLAFQIVDDILDVEGRSEDLGKTVGKDRDSRKATYSGVLGIERSRELARDLVGKAIDCVRSIDRHSHLESLARFILERNN